MRLKYKKLCNLNISGVLITSYNELQMYNYGFSCLSLIEISCFYILNFTDFWMEKIVFQKNTTCTVHLSVQKISVSLSKDSNCEYTLVCRGKVIRVPGGGSNPYSEDETKY